MKRKTNQFISFMLIFVLLFLGCGTNSTTAWAGTKKTSAPTKIVLNAKQETTAVGCSLKLKVQSVKPANASKKVTWSSSNSKIATVSKKGVVKAKKTGTVTITARSAENKKAVAKCKIKVYKATKKMKLVSEKAYTLEQGKSVTLKAKVTSPAKGYEPVKWSTKNDKIAKVSRKGKVTAVSAGTTTVIGQSGKKTVKVTITVKEKQAEQTPDTPKSDNGAQDQPSSDKPAQDNPSSDQPSQDNPGNDNPKPDKPVSDNTTPDNPTPDEPTPSDPTVYTRAEWVHDLVTALGYEATGELNDKVFSDLDGCDQANDILLAASKGVFCLNAGEGNVFRPQDVVTREFAAMTAVNALGIVGDSEFQPSDVDQLSFPMHDSVFVKNNIVALVDGAFMPKQELTEAEREKALQFIAEEVEKSNTIEEKFDVTYTDDVIQDVDQIENAEIDTEQGGFLLPINEETEALTQGNIIFIPYTDYEISNIPFKITETQKLDDKILIKGTVPEFNEVFSRIDIAGNIDSVYSVSANDADDIQQEQFSSEMESDILQSETDGLTIPLKTRTEMRAEIKDEEEICKANISGYIKNIQYEISAEGGNVDVIAVKVNSNLTVEGSITTSDPNIKPLECKIPNPKWKPTDPEKDKYYHWSIQIKVNNVPTGFSFEIQPKFYMDAEGTITVHYEVNPTIGFEYTKEEGFSVTKDTGINSEKPTITGSVSAEAGLGIQCDFDWGAVARELVEEWFGKATEGKPVYDTYLKLGLAFEAKQALNSNCVDAHIGPKITWEIGQNCHICDAVNSLLNVTGDENIKVVLGAISQKVDIIEGVKAILGFFGGDTSKFDQAMPTYDLHIEDGMVVDKCSYTWNGLSWKIDENGKLTISGKYIADKKDGSKPAWLKDSNSIITAEVKATGVESTARWFEYCNNLSSVDFSDFDTSKVTDMSSMFYQCGSLSSLDVSGFDTSNVTDMTGMFYRCSNLAELDLNDFDTSAVTSMYIMFQECSSLEKLDLSSFDTTEVSSMRGMFYKCSKLTELNLTGFQTGKVADMRDMFYECSSLDNVDLSSFDTSNVTDMSGMFYKCANLTELDLSNLDATEVNSMERMFYKCSELTELNLTGFQTGKVADIKEMFRECSSLGNVDLSGFDTSNVTDMSKLFYKCSALTKLDLSDFDTSNVTDMSAMYYGCSSLKQLNINSLDTSNVTTMCDMFKECSSLDSLDMSNFDTSNVTDMSAMFDGCSSLKQLNVNVFDTSNVTNMGWMFQRCSGLTQLDVSNFDTSKVTNMRCMFYECSGLTQLDLSSFNTSNGVNMWAMFSGCTGLNALNLSSFDMNKMGSVPFMFDHCIIDKINVPLNVTGDFILPATYQDASGNEYTYLPKNVTESFVITRVSE